MSLRHITESACLASCMHDFGHCSCFYYCRGISERDHMHSLVLLGTGDAADEQRLHHLPSVNISIHAVSLPLPPPPCSLLTVSLMEPHSILNCAMSFSHAAS